MLDPGVHVARAGLPLRWQSFRKWHLRRMHAEQTDEFALPLDAADHVLGGRVDFVKQRNLI